MLADVELGEVDELVLEGGPEQVGHGGVRMPETELPEGSVRFMRRTTLAPRMITTVTMDLAHFAAKILRSSAWLGQVCPVLIV